MQSDGVAAAFDVTEDLNHRRSARNIYQIPNQLFFQRREKTLRRGIVPAVALAAHAGTELKASVHSLKEVAGILGAAVGVKNDSGRRPSRGNRHPQGVYDQPRVDPAAHGPPNYPAGIEIDDHR